MMASDITIIGAGITGSLIALGLNNQGFDVTLIDQHEQPMMGASRWNEGKIHLGFCYLGDSSLKTAELMLDGAACFLPEIERLTGTRLSMNMFSEPFIYLADNHSLISADILWKRANILAERLSSRAEVTNGLKLFNTKNLLTKLDPSEAEAATGQGNFANAWLTSEIAIAPEPVANAIRAAISKAGIRFLQHKVTDISRRKNQWLVTLNKDSLLSRLLINSSWESRVQLDAQNFSPSPQTSIRYKRALFLKSLKAPTQLTPSTRILGRYGDITPYRNGQGYLGWYPENLAGLSDTGKPPVIHPIEETAVIDATLRNLRIPKGALDFSLDQVEVRGGFIAARGYGDISALSSPLHARHQVGVHQFARNYFSVDTGKYSLGPLLANQAVSRIKSAASLL